MKQPLSVYIHWPFCKAKCPYCDFNSHVRDGIDAAAWQRAMLAELDHMAAWFDGPREVTSVFFGGGTPSLMPPVIAEALLNRLAQHFTISSEVEITLEANPTSVEAANFTVLKQAGVNRVSLGVQSLKPESLKFLGRQHSVNEALDAVALAAKTFPRYSFDLIYALPGQSVSAWEQELREALTHAGSHLSLYQLTIEPNTAFFHQHQSGTLVIPDDTLSAELFELTQAVMEERGLPMYEVSNHAKPGEESRHNLCYWQGGDWLGVGPGAHGRVTLPPSGGRIVPEARPGGVQRIATETIKSPERWLSQVEAQGHGLSLKEPVGQRDHAEELVMMGLRLKEGIPFKRFETQTGLGLYDAISRPACDRLVRNAFLEAPSSALKATKRGMLVLNRLTSELLAA